MQIFGISWTQGDFRSEPGIPSFLGLVCRMLEGILPEITDLAYFSDPVAETCFEDSKLQCYLFLRQLTTLSYSTVVDPCFGNGYLSDISDPQLQISSVDCILTALQKSKRLITYFIISLVRCAPPRPDHDLNQAEK